MHAAVRGFYGLRSFLGSLLDGWQFGLLHPYFRLLGDLGCRSLVGHLLVCCDVEGDEEDEVGA